MTALSAPQDPTVAGDAVPYGPLTFIQAMTVDGHAAVARLHEEALEIIAALAEGGDAPVADARVLRMNGRPALDARPAAAAA